MKHSRSPQPEPRVSSASILAAAAVLLALVAAALSGVAAADFTNYDDPDYVTANPHVRAGLTTAGVRWAVTAMAAANWHPLTWISHMFDVTAFGLVPGPHHLSSVAYHALATVLLFVVLFRIAGRDRASLYRAAVVAALFAIHPLHVESVAWVSERKDVLSTVFWMLTLLAYSRYVTRPSPGRYALVVAGLAMGLAAKPMLVTLPFVLLLLDVWPLGRWTAAARVRRNLVVEKLPLIALAAASSVVTIVAQHSAGAVRDTSAIGLGDRLANAVVAYWTYLAKAIWPTNLAAFYPYSDASLAVVLLGAAGLLAISAAAALWRRRAPYLFVGWFWYLGTLVPVIGIVQVGNQAMADRYTYVPLVGIFIAAVWGVGELTKHWRPARVVLPAVAAVVIVVFVTLTRAQAATWRDSETLWRHALAVTDNNYFAHGGLGAAMLSRGDDAGAESEFRAALRIRPNLADVQNDLGSLLAGRGRVDEALQHFRQAVELDSRFAEAHHNLGMALWQRGRPADAIAEFTASLRINPDLPRTHNDLGRVLATSGRVADAIPHFLEAVRLAPDAIEMRYNAALALSSAGRMDEARQQLNAALSIDPRHAASLELMNKIK